VDDVSVLSLDHLYDDDNVFSNMPNLKNLVLKREVGSFASPLLEMLPRNLDTISLSYDTPTEIKAKEILVEYDFKLKGTLLVGKQRSSCD
jgi:hypothetical protein